MTAAPSRVRGAEAPPLIEKTIGALFDEIAAREAERPALIVRHQEVRWTYGELKRRVDDLAAGFLALGLTPGDRVGIWSPNCAEWTLTQFATAKAGLVLVTINPAYRTTELEHALNKAGCKALVTAASHRGGDYLAMLGELAPELAGALPGELVAARLPRLRLVVVIGSAAPAGCLPFEAVGDAAGPESRTALARLAAELRPEQPINIQFTSGTTGSPKGATLSHRNILNNGFFVGEAIRLRPGDRLCIPVPLYHCFGMVMGNLGCVTHGAAMVYPSEGFDPRAVLEAVEAERCTALFGVPTMFIAELALTQFDRFDLSSLRTGIMAGAPCPVEIMRQVIGRMHMPEVTIAYGMTETSPVSFQTDPDADLEERVSTVGRVQPHLEVKVVDDQGRVVPRGAPGEILTRGYSVMLGYWDDPEKTAEAVDAEGWMRTGDLGVIDEAGCCSIVGRIKDMVIRGGENIYPREIEEHLHGHPAVQDVQVIGVPDARYGEELCAWVVLKPGATLTAAELRDYCRGRIAHFKIPRYVRFVEGFPVTVTGKVRKVAMREVMAAELGRGAARTG